LLTGLPFLIEDQTPRSLRVAEGGQQHANGACGIAGIAVAVPDLPEAAARFRALLDLTRDARARDATTAERVLDFRVGAAVVTLVASADGDPTAGSASMRMGRSPLSLKLRTANKLALGSLNSQRTHNARIELISDSAAAP
jgi:hypothetical protein